MSKYETDTAPFRTFKNIYTVRSRIFNFSYQFDKKGKDISKFKTTTLLTFPLF